MTINNTTGFLGSGSTTTSDETAVSIASYSVPDDSVTVARAIIVARDQASGDVASWNLTAIYKRNAGGAVQLVGRVMVAQFETDSGHRLWFADLVPTGNNMAIRVKGEAGTDIDWSGEIAGRQMSIT
jgi:hypothetical protein